MRLSFGKIAAICGAIVVLVAAALLAKNLLSPKVVHFHAGFKVYVDGQLQDYSGNSYMHWEPCTTGKQPVNTDDRAERAHLHDNVGDVVHVHRQGAVWADLFKNINVSWGNKQVAGYENGLVVANVLQKQITPYESAVFVVGDQTNAQELAKNPVSTQHIKDVEAESETCGS